MNSPIKVGGKREGTEEEKEENPTQREPDQPQRQAQGARGRY